mgnify:CR=1 FL=1
MTASFSILTLTNLPLALVSFLSVVEVIMDIESSYDIEIPDEDAENLFTVAEIKQYIEDYS